ncbi:hypothetical protein RUMTOR_02775 [[Ruminococcus] torques ATCC 27756]|uniref:Uncharacterized protein n=1 Tax=[Ruminococcus] torques ATCC 27756 TaxID=411460 RepID=A5KR83_9FIRM|nr:hypothetical protein RUMTOR_02884 [[Ruminococcus] torques ATCC 27756]EDK22993.1 hypothetical protein RUMTOR_02848 [[Ruminococcus] torques ATCC 27756]EDK23013.1 hypothetical protein RUMTOR_02818 [[Ruminococcus] torques ATCC 27756]EDK23060.1 hypothetical protein RUMTOR_02775 [[Ruminococcus] torques ATCC 27756]
MRFSGRNTKTTLVFKKSELIIIQCPFLKKIKSLISVSLNI